MEKKIHNYTFQLLVELAHMLLFLLFEMKINMITYVFFMKKIRKHFFILFEKAHHQPTYSRHALLQGKNNQRQHTQCLKKEKIDHE